MFFFSCFHAGKGISAHTVSYYFYHSRTLYPLGNFMVQCSSWGKTHHNRRTVITFTQSDWTGAIKTSYRSCRLKRKVASIPHTTKTTIIKGTVKKIHTVISLETHLIFFSACINLYNWPIDSFFLHLPHTPQSSSCFLPVLSHTCYYFPPWCHLHAALREGKWTEMLLTSYHELSDSILAREGGWRGERTYFLTHNYSTDILKRDFSLK